MKFKTNKILVVCAIMLVTTFAFGQKKSTKGIVTKETVKVENIGITVEVDSAKEIEETFKVDDIKAILNESGDNETISFKIICNGESMGNGKKSNVSYMIEGNTNETDKFLKGVEKIRESAINYYNNKN